MDKNAIVLRNVKKTRPPHRHHRRLRLASRDYTLASKVQAWCSATRTRERAYQLVGASWGPLGDLQEPLRIPSGDFSVKDVRTLFLAKGIASGWASIIRRQTVRAGCRGGFRRVAVPL